jgi:hypothetical protein
MRWREGRWQAIEELFGPRGRIAKGNRQEIN